ncbi:putative Melatonin receptor type 1B-B [Hypsibius exemplaris]|uniref:Melatonin receptor type 1B-B n=1 Tax=Hypsibius exemplaris TaxID=2072580 RepID=A0A1W0X842_HYPEX|nr:putative Melatonin receptor type 1B-B [Hypsibius exemplaris]
MHPHLTPGLSAGNTSYDNGNETVPELYLRTNVGLMVFMSSTLVISTIAGTLGNSLALRTCGNMFILNLALADLVITALVDPFNAAGAVSGEHILMGERNTLCQIIGSVCAPVCMSSMWNLCLISLNRYVRICHQHVYHRIYTAEHTFLMCASVWLFCYAALIPTHTGWSRIVFDPDFYLCTADLINFYSYALCYIAVGVFIPLTGVLFGYAKIFQKVRQSKIQVRRHRYGQFQAIVNIPDELPKTKYIRKMSPVSREDLMLVKTLFMAFIVFSVCWLPFAILVVAGHPIGVPKWVYVVAMVMAHGNSAMNPVLYGLSNDHFRKGYRRITGCGRKNRLTGDSTIMDVASSLRPKLMNVTSEACWSSSSPNRVKVNLPEGLNVDGMAVTPLVSRTPSPE